MNPDNNNPIAGNGVPGAGGADLSAADSLDSAADSLTSAGLAVDTQPSVVGLDQINSINPEATMVPPIEEPLVPAAPVPGSIGSVTSVPPLDPADALPPVPPSFGPAVSSDPANPAPAMEAIPDAAQPAQSQMPYNPFANPVPESAPAPNAMPAPQPEPSTGVSSILPKGKPQPIVIILAVAAGIFAVLTIIFIALFIYALNNQKVKYVPSEPSVSTSRVDTATCTREEDLAWLADAAHSVMGTQTVSLSYSDNLLQGVTNTYKATYDDDASAELARDNLMAMQAELVTLVGNSFSSEYEANGGVMTAEFISNDNMTQTDAATLIYGAGGTYYSTSLDSIRSYLESNNFTCSVE